MWFAVDRLLRYVGSTMIKVDVSVYLHGKRMTGYVSVDEQDWEDDPFYAVLSSINAKYDLHLLRWYQDKNIKVTCGETVGSLDMDMTETLDEEVISSFWMDVDISESGEVSASSSRETEHLLSTLYKLFPALNDLYRCPICLPENDESLASLLPHLNDHHEWTRNEIADWLETLDSDIRMDYAAVV